MRFALPLVLAAVFAQPALADPTPEIHASAPTGLSVTVYRDDLVLVRETRTIDLAAGPSRLVFDGVLDRIVPQSAVIGGLGVAERERNFDFDGLTPRSLLWRSIGENVRLITTPRRGAQPTEKQGRVLAAGDGVMLQLDGGAMALGCSGLPERLVFERIPAGLRARPALSTLIDAPTAGQKEITLSYLATGVTWNADYVLTLNEDSTRAEIGAWITLSNGGEEGFADADVGVVAGDLSRVFAPAARQGLRRWAQRNCYPQGNTTESLRRRIMYRMPPPPPPPPPPMAMAAPAMEARAMADVVVAGAKAVREELADYQFYRLANPTTVAGRQTKQVMFLSRRNVEIARVMRHVVSGPAEGPQPMQVLLRTKNEEAKGLGAPLPKGAVRVFQPAGDRGVLFAGEGETRDTAVGLDWEIGIGESAAVTIAPRVIAETEQRISGNRTRVTARMSAEVVNATRQAQTAEIVQAVLGPSLRISQASAPWVMKDGAPTFTLSLPAHGRSELSWRVSFIRE